MKKTIFIDISGPMIIRNVLSAKNSVCRQLSKIEGIKIVLLVPEFAKEEVLKEIPAATAEIVNITVRRNTAQAFSDFISKHMNLTGMQYLGSKYGLRYEATKKRKKSYLHSLRWLVAHTLGKWYWFRVSFVPKMHLWVYRERPLQEVFEKYKPDLVFIPNLGNSQGEETLREAKRQGVSTIGLVGSWDHPHKRYQALQTDEIFVWSDSLKEEMVTLQSYPEDKVHVVGAPHYDMFFDESLILSREELFNQLGLDPNRKLISFYSTTGRTPYEWEYVDMVLNWIQEGKLSKNSQVYVRTYPGDLKGDREKFDRFIDSENIFVDWLNQEVATGSASNSFSPDASFMKRLISVYRHSDIIMSPYSSVSVEASIFLKPIININFDGYTKRPYEQSVKRFVHQSHFEKVTATNGTVFVNSKEEFLSTINRMLEDPDCNKGNVKKLRTVIGGILDGHASDRIVVHIQKKLSHSLGETSN